MSEIPVIHQASPQFFAELQESQRQEFMRGFYESVDFDDRDKEMGWGMPWLHGNYDDSMTFMGRDPYEWGIQYAMQMQMCGWMIDQDDAFQDDENYSITEE